MAQTKKTKKSYPKEKRAESIGRRKHWPQGISTVQGMYDTLGHLGGRTSLSAQIEGKKSYYYVNNLTWDRKHGWVCILRRKSESGKT